MSLIKEKIRRTNNDIVINFSLSNSNQFTGQQQEIDNLTQFNRLDVVNPPIDGEKLRYSYFSSTKGTLKFYFFNQTGSTYDSSLVNVFSNSEIMQNALNVQNSFYVFEFYDTYKTYEQNKIFTSYLTKIVNIYNGLSSAFSTYILYNNNFQLNKISIPNWFVDEYTGNTITGYTKISFYDAKNGRLVSFFNMDNVNLKTPEKYYVKTIINKTNKTWSFQTQSMNESPFSINLKEIPNVLNQRYVEKVNNTVNNFENLKIEHPEGNVFNDVTGDYDII